MAEIDNYALTAGAASANSAPIDVAGVAHAWIEITTTVAAATLQGTILIGGGITDPGGGTLPAIIVATEATPVVTGAAFVAATGVLTFNNPAIGTYRQLIRISNPPKLLQLIYTYTSGGGAMSVRARVWGWKQS